MVGPTNNHFEFTLRLTISFYNSYLKGCPVVAYYCDKIDGKNSKRNLAYIDTRYSTYARVLITNKMRSNFNNKSYSKLIVIHLSTFTLTFIAVSVNEHVNFIKAKILTFFDINIIFLRTPNNNNVNFSI